MKHWKGRLVITAIFLLLALLIRFLARMGPGFADVYQTCLNPVWVNTLGRFSNLFPFSLVEILIAGILLFFVARILRVLYLLIRGRWKHAGRSLGSFFLTLLLVAVLIFFFYEAGEDVYFYAKPFSERHAIGSGAYATEDLLEVCEALAKRVNENAVLVARDADGHMQNDENLPKRVAGCVAGLGTSYPEFRGFVPRGKTLLASRVMDYQHFSGIYSAYTCEANVNGHMPAYNTAFSMSHELAHTKGILPENEANFIAYLACRDATDPDIAYSGAMLALTYCGNELNARDANLWVAVHSMLDARAQEDLRDNREFWNLYKGKTSDLTEALNNDFLIIHGVTEGTKSYDKVVDLIVSYENTSKAERVLE